MIINATNIGRKISGIGRYSLSLSLYLLEHWDYPFQIFINRHALVHFEKAKNKDKIKVISGAVSPDYGFRGHLLRLLWSNKLSLQNQKSLIFNTSPLEGSLHHKKQITTVHDVIPLIFPLNHKKQYYYYKYILPIILENSIKVIVDSHNTKRLIIDLYKVPERKLHVIHCGISELFLNHKPNHKKQNYILYVGRLSPTKNIKGLIKAFDLLINKYKLDLKLKLTGEYRMLNFKINNAIKSKVDFVGNASENDLINLYRNASLFVFPSFYEGFGLPPLEAVACGCPLVVSNVGSLPEVCGDAAYYVNPYDVESITEGMYKVLTNNALGQRLIQKGFERVEMFSWERSAKEYKKVFEEF